MIVKPAEPNYDFCFDSPQKLNRFSDLTEVQNLPVISLSLTPEEMLLTREFIGLEFPFRIHDARIDDMNYIQCVCSVFRKMTTSLKELGLDIEEFDDI